jgi:glycosyltransferase involved in cell wall biosynthesis
VKAAERRRVVFMSGYHHPAQHRKVEFLADAPGYDVLHLTFPHSGLADGVHPSASGNAQYRTRTVPVSWLGAVGNPHRVVHRSVGLRLGRFKPHLIHCEHEQESLLAAQTALARRWLCPKTPLILYSNQNVLRPRSLPVRLVCAYTLRAAQHIQCSNSGAVEVLQRQGFAGSTSVVPLFGVDTRVFYPRPAEAQRAALKLKGCAVGYVGRLVPEKGLSTLLEALARTEPHVQALLIGDGPEKPKLQEQARQLGLARRTHFLPAVAYAAVADYMNALDVLVLPSKSQTHWKEQFGRVLVEAMACRVAVVGSDSGAIPEVVGDAGRIFPEGDSTALAGILRELAAQPEARQALAARGYARAQARYTVERLAAQMVDVWAALVPQAHAHRH